MIDIIYLKKTGLYTRFAKEYKKIDRPFSYYLHHTPKIEKDFTVGDLMEILKEYEQDVNLVFMAYTRGFDITPFYEEMNLPLEKENDNPIVSLKFTWSGDVYNSKEFGKPKYEMSEYVHVTGLAERDNNPSLGIGLLSFNEFKNADFILKNKIEYSHTDYGDIWEEDRKAKTKVFFKGIREFSFEDIVGAFLNEITFHGYPENKKEVMTDLDERVEQSETEEGIPWEVIQLEWAEESLNDWQKKKDSKKRTLHIEKLEKEIAFLKGKLEKG